MADHDPDSPNPPPHEGVFYLQLTEEQVTELSFGRVPALVQEMAKTLVDWTDLDLRKNAAKPIYRGRRRSA
jgi:hypothetical protein